MFLSRWRCVLGIPSGEAAQRDAVNANRPLDVLQGLLAHILESQVQPVAHVIADGSGDRDPARLGNALQPCRYVDTVAKDVLAFDNHVAKIDADAEFDAAVLWQTGVSIKHPALNLGG